MMILGWGGLTAAFVVVAALLVSLNIHSRWPWWVKGAAILVTSWLYIVTYLSWPALIGWPTRDPLPDRFRLLAVHIQEPSKLTGAEGRIFMWATDMDAPTDSPPRSHDVPYSAELHQRVAEAGAKLRKNIPQLGETETLDSGRPDQEVKDAAHYGQKSVKIEFFDMPDPLFPEK